MFSRFFHQKRSLSLALGFAIGLSLLGTHAIANEPGQFISRYDPAQTTTNSSFISPLVELFGDVTVGENVFVSGNTIVRAEPETRICIGDETNLQDNIIFAVARDQPAPEAPCAEISSSAGERVSIAHQAVVRNSRIGDFTFIGFHAKLNNVVLEDGAFVLHGANVANVTIGENRLVPIGAVITSQAEADALPLKTEDNAEFQNDVLEVNEEFAEHYGELFEADGFASVTGVSPAPTTSWNTDPVAPALGDAVQLDEFVRIVGDVRLGANSIVGQRTSIRADEGAPIIIGDNAEIEDRVTFHALKGTNIRIGNNLNTDDNVVFHGPLEVGDGLTIADDAILFRSTVGNHVTIGAEAIVVGVTLPDGAQVPERAVITTQEDADRLMVS
ncbi:carbonate dehydratase [Oculatella sp. LEGE 06141]|uniref:carbonate dehydratase n=1 Tax=Oculatella sp. LEGE 06141 TaxID=1828648 RepID=UPI00187F8156|nr:carbonate dehydratase [Oculatella sp. LEGE 06141]MBE9181434.1 carbonate dehydratase [Oculatella sp. LEGE 06141]